MPEPVHMVGRGVIKMLTLTSVILAICCALLIVHSTVFAVRVIKVERRLKADPRAEELRVVLRDVFPWLADKPSVMKKLEEIETRLDNLEQ